MYLYTDEIDFAPFGSKANRELRIPELVSGETDTIPRPSPKSIYRIADINSGPKIVATITNSSYPFDSMIYPNSRASRLRASNKA